MVKNQCLKQMSSNDWNYTSQKNKQKMSLSSTEV
jgi:hypothetical protein